MCLVLQDNLRLIVVLVAGSNLDVLRVLDHMIVSDDAAVFGEHEPGSLAFLRHHPIEKVESQGGRSDVHHRRQRPLVDRNAIRFFRRIGWLCVRLG